MARERILVVVGLEKLDALNAPLFTMVEMLQISAYAERS